MSDHGARFKELRHTLQGKYEERNPYMALRFPPWFKNMYPDIIQNLNINAHRLTTPFDIHATFLDLMLSKNMAGKSSGEGRGISLLKEVPASRTCVDASIEPHWCACLNWKTVSKSSPNVTAAANRLVEGINNILTNHTDVCHVLQMSNIKNAFTYTPDDSLLKFRFTTEVEVLYQLTIAMRPGNGIFEATVKHIISENTFKLSDGEISRINKYGDQPHCVQNRWPNLRPYCYCREQLKAKVE